MRRTMMLAIIALLGLVFSGAQAAPSRPGACGGFTRPDEDPCCVSGMVLLKGVPLRHATVLARLGTAAAIDLTDYAAPDDEYPTYGFLLDDPAFNAQPGDVVTLEVSYKGYTRTISFTVQPGEQWLDIELAGIHSGEQLRALPGD